MKTKTHATLRIDDVNLGEHVPLSTRTDAQILDDFDALMVRAAAGDAHAIGCIAIVFGPQLLAEARAALGPFEQDACDVLNDLLVSMLEGASPFAPEEGRALPWMLGVIRAMACRYRIARELDWGEDGP